VALPLRLRGGSDSPSDALLQATFACNKLYASVLAEASAEIAMIRKSVAEDVSGFGAKADAVLGDAAAKFSAGTPEGDEEVGAVYAAKGEELQSALMTGLEPVFAKVLSAVKEGALDTFKKGIIGELDVSEAMVKAESEFVEAAKASVPSKTSWTSKAERASLVSIMQAIQVQAKKAKAVKDASQQQLSTAMQYLQTQSQQMQALQAQFTGGQGGKWNLGAAYRPPDTNINLSGSYNQGRANIQVSMVPDEGAGLLGQNGFTNGVGPANLGLSFNVHI